MITAVSLMACKRSTGDSAGVILAGIKRADVGAFQLAVWHFMQFSRGMLVPQASEASAWLCFWPA